MEMLSKTGFQNAGHAPLGVLREPLESWSENENKNNKTELNLIMLLRTLS